MKCGLRNVLLFFPDIRDAETLVLETNARGPEHWDFQEHRSGPLWHAALHGARYFCWAASVGAPRCWWQRCVGCLKWRPFCINDQRTPELCLSVYWSAASCRSSGGYILKIWCHSKLSSDLIIFQDHSWAIWQFIEKDHMLFKNESKTHA